MTTKQQFEAIIEKNHKEIVERMNVVQNMFRFPQFDDKYIAYAMTSAVDGFIKQCAREILFHQDLEIIVRSILIYRDNLIKNLESLQRKHLMTEKELSKVGISHEKIEDKIDEIRKILEEVSAKEKQSLALYFDMVNRLSALQETHLSEWKNFNTKVTNLIVDHFSSEQNIHFNQEEREMIGSIKSPIQIKKALYSAGININQDENSFTQRTLVGQQVISRSALECNAKRTLKTTLDYFIANGRLDSTQTEKQHCSKILGEINGFSPSEKSSFEKFCKENQIDLKYLKSALKAKRDDAFIKFVNGKLDEKGHDGQSLTDKIVYCSKLADEISTKQLNETSKFMEIYQPVIEQEYIQQNIKKMNGIIASQPIPNQTQVNEHEVQSSNLKR